MVIGSTSENISNLSKEIGMALKETLVFRTTLLILPPYAWLMPVLVDGMLGKLLGQYSMKNLKGWPYVNGDLTCIHAARWDNSAPHSINSCPLYPPFRRGESTS